jgi:hypothetical protein
MSVTYIGSAYTNNGSFVSSLSLPSYNQSANNLIVICLNTFETGGTVASVTDTAGNVYTNMLGGEGYTANSSTRFVNFWYKQNCLGNATNVVKVTYNTPNSYSTINGYDVSGAFAFGALDASYTNNAGGGGSNAAFVQNVTTAQASEVIIALFAAVGSFNYSDSISAGPTLDEAAIGTITGGLSSAAHQVYSTVQSNIQFDFILHNVTQWLTLAATFKLGVAPSTSQVGAFLVGF